MLELLGQRDLIERRVEQRTSYTTGLEVMAWKDCASGRPRREAYPVEGLRGNTAARRRKVCRSGAHDAVVAMGQAFYIAPLAWAY